MEDIKYRVRACYAPLFGVDPENPVVTEAKAKEILTKNWADTGKPHGMGIALFSHHPDLPEFPANTKPRIIVKDLMKEAKEQQSAKNQKKEILKDSKDSE